MNEQTNKEEGKSKNEPWKGGIKDWPLDHSTLRDWKGGTSKADWEGINNRPSVWCPESQIKVFFRERNNKLENVADKSKKKIKIEKSSLDLATQRILL